MSIDQWHCTSSLCCAASDFSPNFRFIRYYYSCSIHSFIHFNNTYLPIPQPTHNNNNTGPKNKKEITFPIQISEPWQSPSARSVFFFLMSTKLFIFIFLSIYAYVCSVLLRVYYVYVFLIESQFRVSFFLLRILNRACLVIKYWSPKEGILTDRNRINYGLICPNEKIFWLTATAI